ncbi:MAG: isopenicillin N synthase family oxygenase, partial [bacterium]
KYPHRKADNVGWESRAQVRPSTGTPDQKESYQITRPRMDGLWPADDELPGFRSAMLDFEARCRDVAMRVLSCFALKLGFAPDFFDGAHDPARPDYQSTLRLLHYYAMTPREAEAAGLWRAGA